LIVILVGFMAGTVAGEASQPQPAIGFSEPLTVSEPEGSDSVQQDSTIEMDHVRVAVRASKTQVTPGERVQVSYDGVAFNTNPDPLDILIIADIPSGVTVSGMRAEGCNPQCPISDEQLQPGDRLPPGSFTITPQESGTHTIELRTSYTLPGESGKIHNATTALTVSAKEPTSPPGITDRIGSALMLLELGSPFSIFVVTVTLFILVLVLSRLVSEESERLVIGIAGLVLISGIAIAGIGAVNITPDTTAQPSSEVPTTESEKSEYEDMKYQTTGFPEQRCGVTKKEYANVLEIKETKLGWISADENLHIYNIKTEQQIETLECEPPNSDSTEESGLQYITRTDKFPETKCGVSKRELAEDLDIDPTLLGWIKESDGDLRMYNINTDNSLTTLNCKS
jgi:hypothetical protein